MTTVDRRTLALLLGAAFLLAHLLFLLPAFDPWNLRATDLLFAVRNPVEPDARLAYVELTDEGLGAAAVSRDHFARVIENLAGAGVALQVHDTVFRAPSGKDKNLVAATRAAGNALFGFIHRKGAAPPPAAWRIRTEGSWARLPAVERAVANFPALAAAARGQGFIDLEADADGVYRRTPLLARGPDGILPSLGLAAACAALGIAPDEIVLRPGALVLRDIEIPIDAKGRMRINYAGPWESHAHFTFAHVHDEDPDFLRDDLKGRIVLVADLTTAAGDMGPSPFDRYYPLPGIHMSVLDSILRRSFLRELGWLAMLPFELALLGALYRLARRSTAQLLAGGLGLAVLFGAAAALLFVEAGWILHLARPLAMLAVGASFALAYRYLASERRRAAVQASFASYFPPKLVQRLVEEPERVTLGGRRAVLTVLFSDIAGFTERSAAIGPDEIQRMLNRYFGEMAEIVWAHGGTLDKFVGDGLVVFFGDPEEQPDHALRAVRAALAMQQRLKETGSDLKIRVGISTGEMVVGNMGSPKRLSYTVLGSAVNLAARLEAHAPPGGVLVSQATYDAVKHDVAAEPVEPVRAKGFPEPVPAYLVGA